MFRIPASSSCCINNPKVLEVNSFLFVTASLFCGEFSLIPLSAKCKVKCKKLAALFVVMGRLPAASFMWMIIRPIARSAHGRGHIRYNEG